jgi:hypothetical protein
MSHTSSRRLYSEDQISVVLDDIVKSLRRQVGDLAGEIRLPSDPDDLAESLCLLGRACLIAHEVSNREQAAGNKILDHLHSVARVMGLFERDMKGNYVEVSVDNLMAMLEESAESIDAYLDYFQEYYSHFSSQDKPPELELIQALEQRRMVDYARVALVEMGLSDEIVELLARIRRFDQCFAPPLQTMKIGLNPQPGIPSDESEWWVKA